MKKDLVLTEEESALLERQLREAVQEDCARLAILQRAYTEDYVATTHTRRSALWHMSPVRGTVLVDDLYDAGVDFLEGLRGTSRGHQLQDLATCPICRDARCPNRAEAALGVTGVLVSLGAALMELGTKLPEKEKE